MPKLKGPQSMLKVKEHVGQSGVCSVQHYSKTGKKEFLLLPQSAFTSWMSTPKHTIFDWKVTTLLGPSVICRFAVLLWKHYREENNDY